MIQAVSLTKRYGTLTALDGVSFCIRPGEVVGLLGPNGAGKTTTMRILTGFMPPTSGTVSVAGLDLMEDPRTAKRCLGYLPENPPLYPELTVQETLNFVAGLRGIKRPERQEKIDRALERTGILDVRRRLVGNISKGYRQRLGIAQAILHDPPFLILDEPTIGLDPKQMLEIRDLIASLKGKQAILLSSHILQEVGRVCDRVIIINRGGIVADGKISELVGPHRKRELLVTVAEDGEGIQEKIGEIPGVEAVVDHTSNLEEIFLKLTA